MELLGVKMPLKDLEKIYNEFAEKMQNVVNSQEKDLSHNK